MWPKPLHEDVGGDFENHVGNKEHGEGGVVLHARELEICYQVECFGVGNIDTVEEREEVEYAEEGYNSEVDFGYEFLLSRMRRASDIELVVFNPFAIGDEIRVIVIGGGFILEAALVVY
jgi:hypothetical protein